MSLKLKPREKLLAANAIGNIKLALTCEEYGEAYRCIGDAGQALAELRQLLSGKMPVAVVTGAADGKGNVTSLKKDT